MIYIDPPYNTGNDFIYADDFMHSQEEENEQMGMYDEDENRLFKNTDTNGRFHSDWCSMIYSRLMLARNLLTEDGVIFISIDDNEVENLQKICDEVFGSSNHCGTFVVNSTPNARDYGHIGKMHEYCLFYAKNMEHIQTNMLPDIDKKFKYSDTIGGFNIHPLYNSNEAFHKLNRPNLYYPFFLYLDEKQLISGDEFFNIGLEPKKNCVEIYPPKSVKNGVQFVWRWGREKATTYMNKEIIGYKVGPNEYRIVQKMRHEEKIIRSMLLDIKYSSRRGTAEVEEILNGKVFLFPKPISLIYDFVRVALSEEDCILDFFSGSATTAHAVMQLNAEDGGHRKFIMVQLPEKCDEASEAYKAGYKNICEIGKERIRRAGEQILEKVGSRGQGRGSSSISEQKIGGMDGDKLSGIVCLAKGNAGSQGNLLAGEKTSQRGNVQPVGSDAAGGGVNSVEYRGGECPAVEKRIRPLPEHCERLESGTGNATDSLRGSRLSSETGYPESDDGLVGNRENAHSNHQKANPSSLVPNPLDIGFHVFKLDDTNMKDVYYSPQEYSQDMLAGLESNIKDDRTDLDLLFGCLLDWGLPLSLPYKSEQIDGCAVHTYNGGDLIACFDANIPESVVKEIAKRKPLRAVFRDSGFASSPEKINVFEIFKLYMPEDANDITKRVKVI